MWQLAHLCLITSSNCECDNVIQIKNETPSWFVSMICFSLFLLLFIRKSESKIVFRVSYEMCERKKSNPNLHYIDTYAINLYAIKINVCMRGKNENWNKQNTKIEADKSAVIASIIFPIKIELKSSAYYL